MATFNLQIFEDLPSTDPAARAGLQARLDAALAAASSQGEMAFSLSHCPLASGFVIAAGGRVGLDLEDIRRLHPPILRRVSGEREFQEAPEPRALWVAKEAAFKALAGSTPGMRTISELQISRWRSRGEELSFAVAWRDQPARRGTGVVRIQTNLILGIYYEKP